MEVKEKEISDRRRRMIQYLIGTSSVFFFKQIPSLKVVRIKNGQTSCSLGAVLGATGSLCEELHDAKSGSTHGREPGADSGLAFGDRKLKKPRWSHLELALVPLKENEIKLKQPVESYLISSDHSLAWVRFE